MTAFKLVVAWAVCLAFASIANAQVKIAVAPPQKIPFTESLQAVVVRTRDWNSIQGSARLFRRKTVRSKWKAVGQEFPVVVGRSGLGRDQRTLVPPNEDNTAPLKREGDGRSPAGLFPLTSSFGTAADSPEMKLPYTKLEEFTECVDDTRSSFYNKIVNRTQVGNFDWNSSEKMFTVRPQYELGVFVAYNSYPPVPGNGSCIFLHIWKDPDTGTSGCTAMARENLERIVKWLDPVKNPYLVQATQSEYLALRTHISLPNPK